MPTLADGIRAESTDAAMATEILDWLAGLEGDLAGAVRSCPSADWLVVLARACGEDLAVDTWHVELMLSPDEWYLSSRQAELLDLLLRDLTHDQIVARLDVSFSTYKHHRRALLRKLGGGRLAAELAKIRRRLAE